MFAQPSKFITVFLGIASGLAHRRYRSLLARKATRIEPFREDTYPPPPEDTGPCNRSCRSCDREDVEVSVGWCRGRSLRLWSARAEAGLGGEAVRDKLDFRATAADSRLAPGAERKGAASPWEIVFSVCRRDQNGWFEEERSRDCP